MIERRTTSFVKQRRWSTATEAEVTSRPARVRREPSYAVDLAAGVVHRPRGVGAVGRSHRPRVDPNGIYGLTWDASGRLLAVAGEQAVGIGEVGSGGALARFPHDAAYAHRMAWGARWHVSRRQPVRRSRAAVGDSLVTASSAGRAVPHRARPQDARSCGAQLIDTDGARVEAWRQPRGEWRVPLGAIVPPA